MSKMTVDEAESLIKQNLIVDASKGGLVVGEPHSNGGVKILRLSTTEKDVCEFYNEMEGYEYILNPISTEKYRHVLNVINFVQWFVPFRFKPYKINNNINVIDAGLGVSKFIMIDNRFDYMIINKKSAKLFLNTLNRINNKCLEKLS